jgi:hypothetical protein
LIQDHAILRKECLLERRQRSPRSPGHESLEGDQKKP